MLHHIKRLSNPLFFLLGIFVFSSLRLLEPVFKIRVGKLKHDRIGHLAANTELYLRRQTRRENAKKEFHVFVTGKPANRQLLRMIKRKIRVIENRLLVKLYVYAKKFARVSKIWIELPFNTNEYDEFNNISPQLSLTEQEEIQGRELLTRMEIEKGKPFVCFHARDRVYLDISFAYKSRTEWSYHDYRDCDIENYLPAAEYLAKKGIYALRMGAVVEKKILTVNNKIIDYATQFRSDFGDIYLPAKCKFFLATTAGIRFISVIFNVPIAYVNSVPLGDVSFGKNDLFIPKKYWSVEKKQLLSFQEIIKTGADWWLESRMFADSHIEILENTKEEILALTKEMNDRLDGIWVSRDEDKELQSRFRSLFPLGHRCYGFPSRIGTEFLHQNRELLE